MSSRLATFILIPTHKGNREAVRPLPSNVKRPHASQNISPGTFPKTEISFREFRVFRGSKTGAPGCNPGRAPRAGGRNSDDQSGTSMRIPKVGEDPRVLPPGDVESTSNSQGDQRDPPTRSGMACTKLTEKHCEQSPKYPSSTIGCHLSACPTVLVSTHRKQ